MTPLDHIVGGVIGVLFVLAIWACLHGWWGMLP
jgi:hypothetical protein